MWGIKFDVLSKPNLLKNIVAPIFHLNDFYIFGDLVHWPIPVIVLDQQPPYRPSHIKLCNNRPIFNEVMVWYRAADTMTHTHACTRARAHTHTHTRALAYKQQRYNGRNNGSVILYQEPLMNLRRTLLEWFLASNKKFSLHSLVICSPLWKYVLIRMVDTLSIC